MKKLSQLKEWFKTLIVGNHYTEKEVKEILSKMQHQMAQNVLGYKTEPVVPFEFWMEHGKYDTNLFTLK